MIQKTLAWIGIIAVIGLVSPGTAQANGCDSLLDICHSDGRVEFSVCKEECRDDFDDCLDTCRSTDVNCWVECLVDGYDCVDDCRQDVRRARRECDIENENCEDCTDDSDLWCRVFPPECPPDTILTVQDHCWECVEAQTCEQPCDEGESWDDELDACCPDAVWVADCYCEPGWEYVFDDVYNEDGCLLGTECHCEAPDCSEETDVICQMMPLDCEDGTILAVQDGCWVCVDPITCEPPCDQDEVWDDELGACCPPYLFEAICECGPNEIAVSHEVFDDEGCLLGTNCSCEPVCDDFEYWDSTIENCCPLEVWVSDCPEVCPGGGPVTFTDEYSDDGCFLGTSCDCSLQPAQ